jgi:ABC-type transport system involved in multi-copper enzyme maturation permease subunit
MALWEPRYRCRSLLIAWPQIVGLIASTIVLFVAAMLCFSTRKVRA